MIDIPDSIFPKNERNQPVCPRCGKELRACACPSYDPQKPKPDQYQPKIHLDKSGRHGKHVTLIEGLPVDREYLKSLAKQLKTRTGSGGTCYVRESGGVIEIQGDHRDTVKLILKKEGLTTE